MKNTLKISVLFALAGAAIAAPAKRVSGQQAPTDRPNIIVILADDMGYSDIASYGGEVHTPNLDQLADNGLRFRSFYNAARCCPTRASLLTGLYPHEAGMGAMVSEADRAPKPGPYQGFLNMQSVTIAEVLQQVGYKTYMSGKWHVGERPEHWPRRRGFDRYFGLISGASSYFELIKEPRVRRMAYDDTPWFPPAEDFYMTDAFTDTAITFIERHEQTDPDKPFFLYLAYTAPHWPLHAPEEDIKRYDGVFDQGWDKLRLQRYARMKQLGIIDDRYLLSSRPTGIPAWDSLATPHDWADRMEVYAAMIDRMDQGIGKLVATLKQLGALENTLILFLSDNGGCAENIDGRKLHQPNAKVGYQGSYLSYDEPWANASNTPFRMYKSWTYEGGINTPFIAHWPTGIRQPGTVTDEVGHIVDVMATCVAVAGADYPQQYNGNQITPLKGVSLTPIFSGNGIAPRTLYWEHFGKWAIREGNWKLVGGFDGNRCELYNLAMDPVELRDLSAAYPDQVKKMKDKYMRWAKEVGVRAKAT